MTVYTPDFKSFYNEHHQYLKSYKQVNEFISTLGGKVRKPEQIIVEGKVVDAVAVTNVFTKTIRRIIKMLLYPFINFYYFVFRLRRGAALRGMFTIKSLEIRLKVLKHA